MKNNKKILCLLAALFTSTSALAIPIHVNFTGVVDAAELLPNAFGLDPDTNNTITGTAFIPDADMVGDHIYSPADGGLTLSFTVGTMVFDETMDSGWDIFPQLWLLDGVFNGLDFLVDGTEFRFHAFNEEWTASEYQDGVMYSVFGTLEGRATPVGVPEPGTLGLLGAGLLVVAMQRRRRGRAAA
jgi:hypothetical protein